MQRTMANLAVSTGLLVGAGVMLVALAAPSEAAGPSSTAPAPSVVSGPSSTVPAPSVVSATPTAAPSSAATVLPSVVSSATPMPTSSQPGGIQVPAGNAKGAPATDRGWQLGLAGAGVVLLGTGGAIAIRRR